MKKTMKLFLLGIILFSGNVQAGEKSGVEPAESSRLVASPNQSVVKLFYQGETKGKVIVRIFNEDNVLVHTDKIYNKNGFVRPYNFKELAAGNYRFEITDLEGKSEKLLDYNLNKVRENPFIRASLTPVEESEDKLKLNVLGLVDQVVFVRIFNDKRDEIYSETIDVRQSFSRVYNLENLTDNRVSFEVSTEGKVLLQQ